MLMNCPGGFHLSKDIPEPPRSEFAAKGEELHEIIEKSILAGRNILATLHSDHDVIQECFEYADIEHAKIKFSNAVLEYPYELTPNIGGIVDVVFHNNQTATIIDWKFGKGVPVFAEGNHQLLLAALGVNAKFKIPLDAFRLAIYQPYLHGESVWEPTEEDVKKFAIDLAETERKIIIDKDETLSVGDHCKFCKAKTICPMQREQALALASIEFVPAPGTLSNADISRVLAAKPSIDAVLDYVKAIEAEAVQRIMNGHDIPGYKIVEGRSNRVWANPDVVGKDLYEMFGIDAYEKKLKGPASVEKEVPKDQRELLKDWIIKPQGKPTLTTTSDTRPSIASNPALIFDDINNEETMETLPW